MKMNNTVKKISAIWLCIIASWVCTTQAANIQQWATATSAWTYSTQSTDAQQWFSAAWLWYIDWYNVIWTQNNQEDEVWSQPRIIKTIKNAINRVLGMLWLIALILCLWWWFQMITAAWDESKVKSWTKVLKHAAIWLVVIWVSWLIVTFIFYLINLNADAWTWW